MEANRGKERTPNTTWRRETALASFPAAALSLPSRPCSAVPSAFPRGRGGGRRGARDVVLFERLAPTSLRAHVFHAMTEAERKALAASDLKANAAAVAPCAVGQIQRGRGQFWNNYKPVNRSPVNFKCACFPQFVIRQFFVNTSPRLLALKPKDLGGVSASDA